MKRTPYRIKLNLTTIPNEGLGSMEAIPVRNDYQIVSYLSEEEYKRQVAFRKKTSCSEWECPITGEKGKIDFGWSQLCLFRSKNDPLFLESTPAILVQPTVIYVQYKDQNIARFYWSNDTGIFDKQKAFQMAQLFVTSFIAKFL